MTDVAVLSAAASLIADLVSVDAATPAELNPVTQTPLLGPVVAYVDQAAIDLGMPLWLRETVTLVLLGMFVYMVLHLVFRRLLPWVGEHLTIPTVTFVEALRTMFLLPDLAMTRMLRRLDRRPPEAIYVYGNKVLDTFDGVIEIVRSLLPGLTRARRIPGKIFMLAMVAAFLVWNNEVCVPTADAGCTSLVSHWTESFTGWVDD